MSSSIAAITTGTGGVITTADNSGNLNLVSGTTTIVAVTSAGAAVTGTLAASGVSTFAAGTALLPALTTTGDTNTGVWFPAADTVAASTAGTERMRIDSSGNVGIGTSSPSSKLTVGGNPPAAGAIAGVGAAGGISLALSDNTNNSLYVKHVTAGVATFGTDGGGQIAFATNGFTEAMRIDSSGNVLVGTTAVYGVNTLSVLSLGAGGCAFFKGSNAPSYDAVSIQGTGAGTNYMMAFRTGASGTGTQVGGISSTASATTFSTSSDYRLKDNVTPMTGALATVAQLKPCNYKWIVDGSDGQGFIAHEIQAVVPDCVIGEKDAVDAEGKPIHQGIDTSFLVATLTAAIQELKAIIDTQAAQITALNAKVGI